MKILCCSKDDKFLEKLNSLIGNNTIIPLSDSSLITEHEITVSDILIIDGKHCSVPQDSVNIPTLALCTVPSFAESLLLLQRGVKGYGNRQMRTINLEQAIHSVASGQIWLPPNLVSQLIASVNSSDVSQATNDILSTLTMREQETAMHVAEGLANDQIAEKMNVSLRTIKAHLSSIYRKTGCKNRLELGLSLKGKG